MENITQGLYVNKEGKLSDKAIPLCMTCEHINCKSNQGNDYKMMKYEQEEGWEDEPIFLCDKHRGDRQIYG